MLPLCLTVGLLIAAGDDGQSPGTPVTPPPIPDPPATPMPSLWPKFGEFTDSQGRTITYGLRLREEWDSTEPRGLVVYFHGNSTATQEDMSHVNWPDHELEAAHDLGLAVASVGSPEAVEDRGGTGDFSPYFQNPVGSGRGVRYWVYEDQRLVHELLQSGFNGSLVVDYNQILFEGGSNGTTFLTGFIERYAGLYGGGFYARCGGFWNRGSHDERIPPRMKGNWAPSFPWTPSGTDRVRERFRVFIQTTTGDHLHELGALMEHYYGDVLGLETRADIDGPGRHCSPGTVPYGEVLSWLSSDEDRSPAPRGSNQDIDGDGISNALDDDDDNDGAWDFVDALPLDPRGHRDTDGDGIGDFEDRDADGDGVSNDQDEFSLNAREWTDTDGDGIGDNLDGDDDNDGLPDAKDPQPLEGVSGDGLRFSEWFSTDGRFHPGWPTAPTASVHPRRPATFVYPDSRGDLQSYQFINLADGTFQLMIDRTERKRTCPSELLPVLCDDPPSPFAYFEHYVDQIYVDRNQNGDLTDDGPPLVLARNRGDRDFIPGVGAILEVPYASGERLPYGIRLWTLENLSAGVRYMGTSVWLGFVTPPRGQPVLVGVVDANVDGLFGDYGCVDRNRNGFLEECARDSASTEDLFELDGRTFRLVISPTGHRVEILNPGDSPTPPTAATLPGKPLPPTVSTATPYSLTVSWDEPANSGPAITGYDVRYRDRGSGDAFSDAQHQGTARTATLAGLIPDTVYEAQVRARSAAGTGDWSESGEGKTKTLLTGDRIYYFPHLAVGAGWQTTITLINHSPEEVTCRTDFLSDQGTPLMVSFPSLGSVGSRTDVLLPGGSVHEEANVELSAPLVSGWAMAACSGPVKASLLFRQYDSDGVPVAEAGVNATTVPASRFVTFAEQAEDQAGTGVAYANPSSSQALITFTAEDAAGQKLASEDLTVSPGGHGAQNMASLFGLPSFSGSLEVTSTAPIVSLSLNAEAAPIFSSLPPGEPHAAAQGPTTYYFPHLSVGARWQTTITYINDSSREVTCETEFISDHGNPLLVSFPGRGMVMNRTDVLPPGGSVHEETDVELGAPLAPGWAKAACTGPLKASLLFRQYDSEGMPVAEAGVNATAVPASRFVTFAEQAEGKTGTGVAYANPSETAADVMFTARDTAGQTLASVVRTVLPEGHDAQVMSVLFGFTSFSGSLEVTSTEPIVSLSLNFEAAPVFSSLPPGEVDEPAP